MRQREQALGGRQGRLIFGAQAQDAGDQNQKWTLPFLANKRHRRVGQMRHGLGDLRHHLFNITLRQQFGHYLLNAVFPLR